MKRDRRYVKPVAHFVALRPEERLMACDKHGKVGSDPSGWTCLGKRINCS